MKKSSKHYYAASWIAYVTESKEHPQKYADFWHLLLKTEIQGKSEFHHIIHNIFPQFDVRNFYFIL